MAIVLFKFSFYILFTFIVTQIISIEGITLGTLSKYNEYSLTETMQMVLILLSCLLFLWSARLNNHLKPVSLSLVALMMMVFVRESDFYLDTFLFDGAWQTFVSIILLTTGVYLWKYRVRTREAAESYSQLLSNGFLICGLVVVLVFSRLMGRGIFWKSVIGEEYASLRRVKNIVEESVELMGYTLILFAAIELFIYAVSRWSKKLEQNNKSMVSDITL